LKKFKNKSVLYRYLASFVSIAMICCVVIGMASYFVAANEMRKSAINEQRKRLTLAAEDIYEHFDLLEEMSHFVMTTACYSPSYFSRNAYYELELLEDFQKFRNYSSLFSHFFLHYDGKDFVYSDTGKSAAEPFLRKRVLIEDTDTVLPLLESNEQCFYFNEKGMLAIYPLGFSVTSSYNGAATLSFFLPTERLLNRAQLMSGENFSRMEIRYNGNLAFTTGNIKDPVAIQYANVMLILDNDEIGVASNNYFLRLSLTILFIFAVMLCALASYVAVYNFRPIANLARRHNVKEGTNELEHLDKTLSDIKSELQLSQEQLDTHMIRFKELRNDLHRYFIVQIIQGGADEQMMERMRETGMHFPGEAFYAFVLRLDDKTSNSAVEKNISELTDDNAAFFLVPFGEKNSYAVVVNTNDGNELSDILRDACPGVQVFGGRCTETLSEIPSLLFDALTSASPSCIKPGDIARCSADERLNKFHKSLEDGDEKQALMYLNEYVQAYADGNQTIKELIHSNIISTLLSVSYEIKMNVPHAFLRGKYESWPMLEGWVAAVCSNRENTVSTNEEHQILRYLREHALDYNLTLERVAENFHRSTRQITRIIQNETGGSYKDFVLKLRMEHAKKMLREGYSVLETCEKVCYVSRSHFIKTFTTYTGMTPSRYRDSVNEQTKQDT